MPELTTFISQKFRPEVLGGRLNKDHKSFFNLDIESESPALVVNAICFGPKKDNVLINLEHVIRKLDKILIFYYEDIHQRWTYVNTQGKSYFLYKKNDLEQYLIKPTSVYIRGCYIDPYDKYWAMLGDFFNFIELYDGHILCHPRKQMPNESKLFQLNNSLKKASKNSHSISIGQSYVIKGADAFDLLDNDKSYIVKSLSGVRSIVVDKQSYKNWDHNSINNIPVLFQEKIDGYDVRIHILENKIFGKRSPSKKNIDYRYDDNFFKLADENNFHQEIRDFCVSVSNEESNKLLGIDLIQTQTGYVVLEANPSPGWSAYHPYNGIDAEPFITELLRVLKSD